VQTFTGKLPPDQPTETIDVTTEDYGGVMLQLRNGSRGMMWVSQVTAGRKNCLRFELAGSQQSLSWNSERANELKIGHRDEANEVLIRDPALLSPRARATISYPGGHNEGFGDTFKQLFRDFYGAIASRTFTAAPTFPTFADGHQEILVCEAIMNSHVQRQWVTIGA
jgi:predicted dehydrogenase